MAQHVSVNKAASVTGVHLASAIQQIDTLENELATPLLNRHVRGYSDTEAGCDTLEVATMTDNTFADLESRIKCTGSHTFSQRTELLSIVVSE